MANTTTAKDILQICPNGHVITHFSQSFPQTKKSHCITCGKATITKCENCGNSITGGLIVIDLMYDDRDYIDTPVPDFCEHCGSPFPWASLKREPEIIVSSEGNGKRIENHVFVVHGHNTDVKDQVEDFLKRNDLIPIILHQQPNLGKTLIEKVEHYGGSVQFAITILTSDDFGGAIRSKGILLTEERSGVTRSTKTIRVEELTQGDIKTRARQNVIIEFGFFIGKLGRKQVAAIYEEGVELPSDIEGLLYIKYDNSRSWEAELKRELEAAGIKIPPRQG